MNNNEVIEDFFNVLKRIIKLSDSDFYNKWFDSEFDEEWRNENFSEIDKKAFNSSIVRRAISGITYFKNRVNTLNKCWKVLGRNSSKISIENVIKIQHFLREIEKLNLIVKYIPLIPYIYSPYTDSSCEECKEDLSFTDSFSTPILNFKDWNTICDMFKEDISLEDIVLECDGKLKFLKHISRIANN